MNNIIEKIKENKITTGVVSGLILLVIILASLFFTGVINAEKLSFWNSFKESQTANVIDVTNTEEKSDEVMESESVMEKADPSIVMIDGYRYFSKVKVPVLSSGDIFDYKGKKVACGDEMAWATVDITPTRAPLNGALNYLFDTASDSVFVPGNFFSTQDTLTFEKATIENAVAKIYVNGEFTVEEDCDISRQFTQLEEVALQFESVNAVQIYLNGKLVR